MPLLPSNAKIFIRKFGHGLVEMKIRNFVAVLAACAAIFPCFAASADLGYPLDEEFEGVDFKEPIPWKQQAEAEPLRNIRPSAVRPNSGKMLAKLRAGNATIAFIGDSHIAPDIMADEMRLRYLKDERGFGGAYPEMPNYHLNKQLTHESQGFEKISSRPVNGEDNGNFPIGGMMARAETPGAEITIGCRNDLPCPSQQALIMVMGDGTAISVTDAEGRHKVLAPKGNGWNFFELNTVTLPLKFMAHSAGATLGAVHFSSKRGGGSIYSMGLNGAKTGMYKKWDEGALKKFLAQTHPDFVIMDYGTNDEVDPKFDAVKYKAEYSYLIDLIKRSSKGTEIILMIPPAAVEYDKKDHAKPIPFYKEMTDVIKRLGKEKKLFVFDMKAVIDRSGGKLDWVKKGLSRRDVHLTNDGYRKEAQAFSDALERHLAEKEQGLSKPRR